MLNDPAPRFLIALLALTLVAGPGWSRAPGQPQDVKTQAQRLEVLQAAGAKAAITILPALVVEKPNRNVADALGLVLEQAGLENIETTDTAFTPPAGTAWEQWPALLGEFVQKHPPATAYVLLAEYLGTPQTGPKEVRFAIVDQAGAVVLADRQTPADADFKATAARDPDPMGCSVLVGERMRKLLKLPPVASPPRDGKFARLWAQKSGTPTEGERAAMKTALDRFKKALPGASVLVFPARVNEDLSAEQAARVSAAVAEKFECQGRVADTPFDAKIAFSSNELRRLWDLARAFRDHVRQTHPDADYALVAEFLFKPDGPVHSVHFVLCDRAGEWVIVDLQNDQQDDFRKLAPKSAEDCGRLVVQRLAGYVR